MSAIKAALEGTKANASEWKRKERKIAGHAMLTLLHIRYKSHGVHAMRQLSAYCCLHAWRLGLTAVAKRELVTWIKNSSPP